MTNANVLRASLPADIVSREEVVQGSTGRGTVYLIASEVNHPPASEWAVHEALYCLHRISPIDRVFVTFDASYRLGWDEPDWASGELVRDPNEELSDIDIKVREEVTSFFVNMGACHGARSFSYCSSPASAVETFDDWYRWATAADAVDLLNKEAAKITLTQEAILATNTGEVGHVRDVFAFIRLEWDSERWLREHTPEHGDVFGTHAGREADRATAAVRRWCRLATDYYAAGAARIEYLCSHVEGWLRKNPGKRAAVVLGLPWIFVAREHFRRSGVTYGLFRPVRVRPRSGIEDVTATLGQAGRWLQDMAEGKQPRGPVEYVDDRLAYEDQARADRWAHAAARLTKSGREDEARTCFQRAMSIDPTAPWAYFHLGSRAMDRHQFTLARQAFVKAVRLDARSPRKWANAGLALLAEGHLRPGLRCLRYSISLNPQRATGWRLIGQAYIEHAARPRLGYFCLRRAAKLGDDEAASSLKVGGSKGKTFLSRPLTLWKHVAIAVTFFQEGPIPLALQDEPLHWF